MTANEHAAKLWAAAQAAARMVKEAGGVGGYVQAGIGLPVDVMQELAALAGVDVKVRVYEADWQSGREWIVLYSLWARTENGAGIAAQGDRPATPEEIAEARRALAGEPVTVSESQAEVAP